MRFHLVGLPHTEVTDEFSACAFTMKIRFFAKMMMDLGHEVYLYAGEENQAPCTEHIPCITKQQRLDHCQGRHFIEAVWDANTPGWKTLNENAIREIQKRKQPKDFICVIGGWASKPIEDAFPDLMTVEFGIGYGGAFAKYRVWESYAWMHTQYGAATHGQPTAADGRWFDAVIPGYFQVDRFPYSEKKSDYYFFIGRLTERKGYQIAADVCKHLGKRLIVAGQGTPPDYGEYVGVVGPEKRGELMKNAIATFVPTIYIEPFGNVAVESQACGTPVITTDWGAMTETVIEGKTGFHCRTFKEFCDATEKVKLLSPKDCRDHARANYSLEVIAQKYDRYFRRLLTLWDDGWYQI